MCMLANCQALERLVNISQSKCFIHHSHMDWEVMPLLGSHAITCTAETSIYGTHRMPQSDGKLYSNLEHTALVYSEASAI